jgi:hypothetical protein
MMQNTTPLTPVKPEPLIEVEDQTAADADPTVDRLATIWVARITSIVGLLCLAFALAVWYVRPGHYRFVLALLTVAMFAAILHSYTFENGG